MDASGSCGNARASNAASIFLSPDGARIESQHFHQRTITDYLGGKNMAIIKLT